ncbi:restriction endonuclease [Kitasatospora sp. NPDC004531]
MLPLLGLALVLLLMKGLAVLVARVGWPIFMTGGALAVTAATVVVRSLRQRRHAPVQGPAGLSLLEIDSRGHRQFEETVCRALQRDGIRAERVGGAGDRGADVIGIDAWGRRVVVQCKHTTVAAKVGDQVLQVVSGTARPIHRADLAVIVTNGGFTRNALKNASDYRIHLVDRQLLERWVTGGEPLYKLISVSAPVSRGCWWKPSENRFRKP